MEIAARRSFRLALTVALALAVAYALALELPYLAPVFAIFLSARPKPPMGPKGLLGLILLLCLTLGIGLLLVPVLTHYPATGLMLVALGLFFANYLSLNLGKGPVGTLLAVGVALISAAGVSSYALATMLIEALVVGIAIAVLCQWLVYPFFSEDRVSPPAPPSLPSRSAWLALRATLVVYPGFLLGLINPALYMPVVLKSLSLGQQSSETHASDAGRELIGSTMMGGLLAVLLWIGLGIAPNLWMFFLWALLFTLFGAKRLYAVAVSRYPPSFWLNALVTMLILLGPAVADSATGKDVYKAFAVRMALFMMVALYAWLAVRVLERLRDGRSNPGDESSAALEAHS